jgi:nucleoside-diphosphate-sugar epimerase|tara:strand:- start:347 stop:1423 length:1077 start_codon:yes stop_codon:yes gene_type:complete
MKTALVCGAGGFIGNHLVTRLKKEGYWVRGVDLKYPEFSQTQADEFVTGDLTGQKFVDRIVRTGDYHSSVPVQYQEQFDEIYQLAADMGGAGYIFTGDHDANVMRNSATINLNILNSVNQLNQYVKLPWYSDSRVYPYEQKETRIFYSSSACMYPEHNQLDPDNPNCEESSAYPANPDSEYGWEKLFSERLYMAYQRNYGIPCRIARFHNIYGPQGTWQGGREKAPAAMCRKVAETEDGGSIDVWGDGSQTRSFLYIDECVEGIRRLMDSDVSEPLNLGSDEMVTINQLIETAETVAGKKLVRNYIDGPLGVRGRNSDNTLIKEKLGWAPHYPLLKGITHTYDWIYDQINISTLKTEA